MQFVCFHNNERRACCHSHERIVSEATNMNVFDKIECLSENDLSQHWLDKNLDFCNENKKGFGFYSWKPQVILQTLCSMPDNKILVYADTGCEFHVEGRDRFKYYQSLLDESHDMIVFNYGAHHLNTSFCKKDVIDHFCKTGVFDNRHIEATSIIIKNTPESRDFIEKWRDLCEIHHLIDDSPSVAPNHETFVDHRHDQSIFSFLVHSYPRVRILNTELYNPRVFPIYAARNRNRT